MLHGRVVFVSLTSLAVYTLVKDITDKMITRITLTPKHRKGRCLNNNK
jgi:hypothetical protein